MAVVAKKANKKKTLSMIIAFLLVLLIIGVAVYANFIATKKVVRRPSTAKKEVEKKIDISKEILKNEKFINLKQFGEIEIKVEKYEIGNSNPFGV